MAGWAQIRPLAVISGRPEHFVKVLRPTTNYGQQFGTLLAVISGRPEHFVKVLQLTTNYGQRCRPLAAISGRPEHFVKVLRFDH